MKERFDKNEKGHWSALLPFESNRNRLNNNREQALKRNYSLLKTFMPEPVKMKLTIKCIEPVFNNGFGPKIKEEK